MKILVYTVEGGDLKVSKEAKARIRKKAEEVRSNVIFTNDHEKAVQEIADTDILFGYITPVMLTAAKALQWIQAPMSSLGTPSGEYYIFPELMESDVILTNMSGIYSDVIPTHVFAFITCFARDFPTLMRNQLYRRWKRNITTINLRGKTLGVIGLGGIGKGVARIGAAFGMRIIAVEPTPQDVPAYVDRMWAPQDVKNLLREADFVVLCLPDAPGTVKIIGAEELKAMKTTAFLINIGRGRTIDLQALTHALETGMIAGAGLDVFPPGLEPLPSDHPLWAMDNVIITPHCAGSATPSERRVTVFLENLDRYVEGQELLNRVDKKKMVRVGRGYDIPVYSPLRQTE
jgi:phosphoglycerate dehydrogenase-like enzyme